MAQEPDYRTVLTDMNVRRRMGRLLKMSVYCGLKALGDASPEHVAGIITVTGMGFMKDTVSFGNSIFDRQEEMLNPSPFMQSTFNTASGYLALIRKIRSYNTTYVHGAGGMAAALADAFMLLAGNDGKGVLLGAFDEAVPEVDIIRRRLCPENRNPLGEGACALYLSSENPPSGEPDVRLCAVAPASSGMSVFSPCLPGANADVHLMKCGAHVAEMGEFQSLLPVLLCRAISEGTLEQGFTVIMDDVNEGGLMLLVEKS